MLMVLLFPSFMNALVSVNNNVPVQAPPAVRQAPNPPSKQTQVAPNSVQPPNSNTVQNFPPTKNNGIPVVAPNSSIGTSKPIPQKATVPLGNDFPTYQYFSF